MLIWYIIEILEIYGVSIEHNYQSHYGNCNVINLKKMRNEKKRSYLYVCGLRHSIPTTYPSFIVNPIKKIN